MKNKKAVVYARCSSTNQQDRSIDAQIRAIREYADRNEISIIHIYADEAKSATTDNRPQFLQMIKDSKTKSFDYVIVHKLDRFTRDKCDYTIFRKKLADNNVNILSVSENFDNNIEDIILESVMEGMNEYLSDSLSEKDDLIEK